MNRRVDTWMPLVVDRYLGDTMHLTAEQHGAYLLLLMNAWKREGRLPNDEAQLANIARLTPQRWKANRAVLLAFWQVDGDGITQKRLSIELANSKAIAEKRAKAGTEGATKRWQTHSKRIANALANGEAKPSQTDASPSLSIPKDKTIASVVPSSEGGSPAGALSRALRAKGIESNPMEPRLLAFASAGISPELAGAAADEARRVKGANARISPGYVYAILDRWLAEPDKRPAAAHDPNAAALEAIRMMEARDAQVRAA